MVRSKNEYKFTFEYSIYKNVLLVLSNEKPQNVDIYPCSVECRTVIDIFTYDSSSS